MMGMRPQAHAGFRCRVPDDAAAGRVHDEGAGAGALGAAACLCPDCCIAVSKLFIAAMNSAGYAERGPRRSGFRNHPGRHTDFKLVTSLLMGRTVA